MKLTDSSLLTQGAAAFLSAIILVLACWGAESLRTFPNFAADVAGIVIASAGIAFFIWAISPVSQTDQPE